MATDTFLNRITAATRADLAARMTLLPLAEMQARAAAAPPVRDFAAALRPAASEPARLIAEVKRASPSKGVIVEAFDPVAQARAYQAGGAAAISVLTEPRYFLGALEHLTAVRAVADVPVLRKDFILDPYQVHEARAAGADAVLLLCALLDDATLADLLALTHALGMEALVEAHDADEVRRAVAVGAAVIGVNNRDLRTFAVDPDVVRRLRPLVPDDRVFVAESGIADIQGAARARAFGASAILVGEALMRSSDPAARARALATAPTGAAAIFTGASTPFVKICGLMRPDHGALVAALQADAFGLIFAPSKRRITPEQAREIVGAARSAAGARPPIPVGVFVNEPLDDIVRATQLAGLGAVQMSGDETPEHCAEVAERTHLPVVKALRLRSHDDLPQLDAYALSGATPLLDSPTVDGAYGGTGQTGDWDLAREAARRWPVILSGGLSPANVAAAIRSVMPRGVDVSSGVESDGAKDTGKIRAFVRAAREALTTETSSPR